MSGAYEDYSLKVHKSLQVVDLPLGIGLKPLALLLVVGILGVEFVSIWFLVAVLAIYFVLRLLCKSDPYLIEIMMDNVLRQDEYLG